MVRLQKSLAINGLSAIIIDNKKQLLIKQEEIWVSLFYSKDKNKLRTNSIVEFKNS